jgi:acetolactate synthase-1/2/3 large subunit
VHLTTNGNVLTQPAADATVDLPPWAAVQLPQVFASDGDSGAVLRHLARARRPIVLAGIAAQRAGATDALVAFAEAIGCPVVVSPMARCMRARSTWHATRSSGISSPARI